MSKIERIIEWQEDKQRTPKEVLEYLTECLEAEGMDRILVICVANNKQYFVPGSKDRDYSEAKISWDLQQFKYWWLKDCLNDDDDV
jgi:hypothetical protein